MTMQAPFGVPAFEPSCPTESAVYRSVAHPYALVERPSKGNIYTLYDLMCYAAKEYADNESFGTRPIEAIIEEEKEIVRNGQKEVKKWQYYQLGPFQWQTYGQAFKRMLAVGAGLREKFGVSSGDRLLIFNSSSADWAIVAHGVDGLVHALNETESKVLFTHVDLLPVVAKLGARVPLLRNVIYNGDLTGALPEVAGIEFHSMSTVEEAGRAAIESWPPVPPKASDIACIMYTSGSTGAPKGVQIAHSNIVAAVGGAEKLLEFYISKEDVFLAYLPLAHVLEFTVEHVGLYWGIKAGYGSPRTLTDASVRNCRGDLCELRPTIMTGVPAVWDTIRKAVLSKLEGAGPVAQNVFNAAFKLKWSLMQSGLPSGFLDPIFSKIRAQTGGRLRYALSGGAAISEASQQFLSVTLCPILQGYGMTENCGICTILSPEMFQLKASGAPVPCVEIKLVDAPEAGYFAQADVPRGEVWVRGPAITKGYYKRQDLTDEAFTSDGWLMTGDIGQWNEDGTMTIIDRKKNLVKLANGEYIPLEKLESVYKTSRLVSNICVYADSSRSRAVGIVFPIEREVLRIGEELGLSGTFDELCQQRAVRDKALRTILAEVKEQGLRGTELIADVYLCDDEWTPQNGLLTAAHKIKRIDIARTFKSGIDEMYTRID